MHNKYVIDKLQMPAINSNIFIHIVRRHGHGVTFPLSRYSFTLVFVYFLFIGKKYVAGKLKQSISKICWMIVQRKLEPVLCQ